MSTECNLECDEETTTSPNMPCSPTVLMESDSESPKIPSKGIKRRRLDFTQETDTRGDDNVDGPTSIMLMTILKVIVGLLPRQVPIPKSMQELITEIISEVDDESVFNLLGQLLNLFHSISPSQKAKSWDSFWKYLKNHSSFTMSFPSKTVKKLLKYLESLHLDKRTDEVDSVSHTSMRQTQPGTTSTSFMTVPTTKDIAGASSSPASILDVDAISSLDLQAVSHDNSTNILWNISSKNKKGKCTYKWPMTHFGSHVFQLKVYPTINIKHLNSRDWWKTAVKTIQGTSNIEEMNTPLLGVSARTDAEYKLRKGLQEVILAVSQLKDLEAAAQNPSLEVIKEITF